jgi:hypothetical protein
MTVMLAKTYAALKAAGVSEEQAVAAAEELGHLNDQVGGLGHAMQEMHADLKAELVGVRADFKTELGGVRAEVAYLRGRFDVLIWAVGINAAATIAILGVLLRH